MTALVNAASGQVLGIVDGRGSAAVTGWLGARSQAWRDRIQVVAIDPSAAFRKAITTALPHAHIAVDPFHLVQLANLCLTRVRHHLGRQGRPPARPGQHHPRQGSHRQGPTPRLGARQPTPRKPASCGTR
ncbi:MAG: transposase [Arachnia propionica]